MSSETKYAQHFKRGEPFLEKLIFPLGIHYTSADRIPSMMKDGIDAPEGDVGRNYFVSIHPGLNDQRLRYDTQMRQSRKRELRYLLWLSHFALEKVERDESTPAMVIATMGWSDFCRRVERDDERHLQWIGKYCVHETVPSDLITTYVELERREYEALKQKYSDSNLMPLIEFLSRDVIFDLPMVVSSHLFRKLYRQYIHGRFLGVNFQKN